MPRRPDPPAQIRRFLTVAKRQGVPFEEAWAVAVKKTGFPHDRQQRHDYYAAIDETKWAFRLAYHDEDVPAGRELLALAEVLSDVEERPAPARVPAVRIPLKDAMKDAA